MDEQAYDYLDRELQAAAGPDAAALARVQSRLAFMLAREADAATQRPVQAPRTSRSAVWLAGVAAAAACLALGTVLGAVVTARGVPGGAVGSLVFPGIGGSGGSSGIGGGSAGGGIGGAGPSGGPCSLNPSVQVQGRGLAASGYAQVEGATQGSSTVSITIQERADTSVASASLQAKIKALQAALAGAGVAPDAVHVVNVSLSSGDPTGKVIFSSATVQVRAKDADQEAKVAAAAVGSPGVTGYSVSGGQVGQASPQALQAAIASATTQARDLAGDTARAAGVSLGSVESVVTTPPTACGSGYVVQVTITYALK